MLLKEHAIRIENVKRKNTTYRLYIFNCKDCNKELKIQIQTLKRHSGKCNRCVQRGIPFQATFNELKKTSARRDFECNLTFIEFLDFTNETKCHYCYSEIKWNPYTKDDNGKVLSRAYNLDRKDSVKGYSKENCVVCCWRCNQTKNNVYSYEEWFGMTSYFRNRKNES
jgi:hypothetical protein